MMSILRHSTGSILNLALLQRMLKHILHLYKRELSICLCVCVKIYEVKGLRFHDVITEDRQAKIGTLILWGSERNMVDINSGSGKLRRWPGPTVPTMTLSAL